MSAQTDFNNFRHPLQPAEAYSTRTAYFCMEFGIDQALKIFSGGLGYLAGSHMRSAYGLKQNLIGIGILWKNGYYDQVRDENSNMDVLFRQRLYNFLEDTNIVFPIIINGHPVYVKAFYLAPEVFGTAPMFFLTTDIPQNDFLARSISHRLYDNNSETKIAQYILLGLGGAKLLEEMNYIPDIYHLNEAHASPAIFHLYNKYQSVEEIRSRFVFTTHTPVAAGNEKHDIFLLERLGFFDGLPISKVREITHVDGQIYNQSLVCLRMSKLANGVSKMHGEVARNMWKEHSDICEITHITNSQNHAYWHDPQLDAALEKKDVESLKTRKRELKKELFKIVVDQTGNLFDPDVITLVWARRFARYKRADLITRDIERFERILHNSDRPIQIIWAGKPYPMDYDAIKMFNHLIHLSRGKLNCAVVTGYELGLSKALKQGSDLWLNNPRLTREASGTSGMTAAMNACVNFSVQDGWIPEFAKHGHNSFVIPTIDAAKPHAEQDAHDRDHLLDVLEHEILPMYYDQPDQWWNVVQNSMREIRPFFDSDRMADEYYKVLYNAKVPASLAISE